MPRARRSPDRRGSLESVDFNSPMSRALSVPLLFGWVHADARALKNTIFVANLPFNVDDEALASIFTNLSIGVKSAKVVRGQRRGRGGRPFFASRGFGFVEIENSSQQSEAVEKVQGSVIGERQITAKIANEMKPIDGLDATEAAEVEQAVTA